MNIMKIFLIFLFCILLNIFPQQSWAGGGIANMRKRQQQMQEQAVAQQMMAQRQQQMQQAQQQILAQRQAQQQAAQKKAAEQQQLAMYQQALAQRQAQQQAIQQVAYQKALLERQAAQHLSQTAQQQILVSGNVNIHLPRTQINFQPETVDPSQVQDVTTIAAIWNAMETSSEVWALMMESNAKAITVSRQIDLYKSQKITIRKDPAHYVELIDQFAVQTPDLLKHPFKDVLRFVAVLEYDFDNGQDKDEMAMHMLGEKGYEVNRKRLGL